MQRKLYQILASSIQAMENCRKSGNDEWFAKHRETIESLVRNYMPSGSGFDSGSQFDFDASNGNKLIFHTSYHHMNDGGMYDGWTDHTVTVRPSLTNGIDLTISGRDRNGWKEYAYDCFHTALTAEFVPDMEAGCYKLAA